MNIVETLGNQVSLSLQWKMIAGDLMKSESRYQKLRRDLELKVKRRTHELEVASKLLNKKLAEKQLIEKELKKNVTSFRELNATKEKFFRIIAHDLKNPFTCLIGTTEILNEKLETLDDDRIRNLTQIIHDSAMSGYTILQNLLLWSMSQTGMITYKPELFNLNDLIEECVKYQQGCYPRKQIRILRETHGEMKVCSDRNMIASIIRNLVDNAIKFTPLSGTIEINASNDGTKAKISVKDNGIGIPRNLKKELFSPDKNLTRPGTAREKGTGLGLKICRELTTILGGTLLIRSEANRGSEFILEFLTG